METTAILVYICTDIFMKISMIHCADYNFIFHTQNYFNHFLVI